MMNFIEKGNGRIFTTYGNKSKIEKIIKEIDDFEYDYLPYDLIQEIEIADYKFDTYVGKFNLDLDILFQECLKQNIPIAISVCYLDIDVFWGRDENYFYKTGYLSGMFTKEYVLKNMNLEWLGD